MSTSTNDAASIGEALKKVPPIVDLDAHVVEPREVWSSRLPAHYREIGPRIEYLPAGEVILDGGAYIEKPGVDGPLAAWWLYEDHSYSLKRMIAAAGCRADDVTLSSITYEDMRPGCYQPEARLEDMDANGVEAQLAFPNYPRFCGQLFLRGKDKELAHLCVKAYNDWMVEEWCGPSDGRLVPLCLVPLWDPKLAAQEVLRNAGRGARAVAFCELPPYLGLPSIYSGHWEPFFAACEESRTVICMHIGSGTKTPHTSNDAPDAVDATILFGNSVASMADFLFSGVLHRRPSLKLLYAEAQIGWIPYLLERADDVWETHRGWSGSKKYCPEPPSVYYHRQVYSCFFKDKVGIDQIDQVGADHIAFETDYPHQDGTWPRSREAAAEQFGHLDEKTVRKIARGNAIELLDLALEP